MEKRKAEAIILKVWRKNNNTSNFNYFLICHVINEFSFIIMKIILRGNGCINYQNSG